MMNEDDLESPGYEFLRSYENMSNLYMKLLALNYEKEFCYSYKCPPIHRFYFSLPSNNPSEQRFVFTCFCAWLIKDKCHMNLEIEPDEYEDLDVILGVIIEALRLITEDDSGDEATRRKKVHGKSPNYLNQSRLKRGYGPEVIWALNILADRTLEMTLGEESNPSRDNMKLGLVYKQGLSTQQDRRGSSASSNSITVGQPFVGGGLTTRPLGNYIIDDKSLLLNDGDDDDSGREEAGGQSFVDRADSIPGEVDFHEWYRRVENSRHILESVRFDFDSNSKLAQFEDWSQEISQLTEAENCVSVFLDKSRPTLEGASRLIDRQLQLIQEREKYLRIELRNRLDDFLKIWRNYSVELTRNRESLAQVDSKTDKFEGLDNRLLMVRASIEARKRELNDGSKLDELKNMIDRLKAENKEYDTRIGLLLAIYFKLDSPTFSRK